MMNILTALMSTQLVANGAPTCPERVNYQDKYSPKEIISGEKAQQFLRMV